MCWNHKQLQCKGALWLTPYAQNHTTPMPSTLNLFWWEKSLLIHLMICSCLITSALKHMCTFMQYFYYGMRKRTHTYTRWCLFSPYPQTKHDYKLYSQYLDIVVRPSATLSILLLPVYACVCAPVCLLTDSPLWCYDIEDVVFPLVLPWSQNYEVCTPLPVIVIIVRHFNIHWHLAVGTCCDLLHMWSTQVWVWLVMFPSVDQISPHCFPSFVVHFNTYYLMYPLPYLNCSHPIIMCLYECCMWAIEGVTGGNSLRRH